MFKIFELNDHNLKTILESVPGSLHDVSVRLLKSPEFITNEVKRLYGLSWAAFRTQYPGTVAFNKMPNLTMSVDYRKTPTTLFSDKRVTVVHVVTDVRITHAGYNGEVMFVSDLPVQDYGSYFGICEHDKVIKFGQHRIRLTLDKTTLCWNVFVSQTKPNLKKYGNAELSFRAIVKLAEIRGLV